MPTSIYEPFDNSDLKSSHVITSLIIEFFEEKIAGLPSIVLRETECPLHRLLHRDDLASTCTFMLENYDGDAQINSGWGRDIPIAGPSTSMGLITGYGGSLEWDSTEPNGTPRELLDTQMNNLFGCEPSVTLRDGIESTYR
jgi:GDP-L-fucose synthase